MVKKEIDKTVSDISNGSVKLIELKKENGQKQKIDGIDLYQFEFNGKIQFLKNGYTSKIPYREKTLVSFSNDNFLVLSETENPFKSNKIKEADTKNIEGWVLFEKKENGWSIDDKYIGIPEL